MAKPIGGTLEQFWNKYYRLSWFHFSLYWLIRSIVVLGGTALLFVGPTWVRPISMAVAVCAAIDALINPGQHWKVYSDACDEFRVLDAKRVGQYDQAFHDIIARVNRGVYAQYATVADQVEASRKATAAAAVNLDKPTTA